jgi:4-hydroxy-2-oxoheptanedioate aldolase
MEASHASKQDLLHILQAINAYNVTPIVRISDQNKHLVESCLDFGVKGIMIPKVETTIQCEDMANACYYPPLGNRGVNCIRASAFYTRAKQYFDDANQAIISIVQIESKESINNIYEIAAVKNVDILFVGLGDLAASYGQLGDISGKLMDDARKKVVDACQKFGKIPGIYAHSNDAANQYIKEGYKFIAIGNDIKFLNYGLLDSLKNARLHPQ